MSLLGDIMDIRDGKWGDLPLTAIAKLNELAIDNVGQKRTVMEAVKPILDEAKERTDYMHHTYDPDAHIELTLTIAEVRAVRDLYDKMDAGEL